MYVFLSEYYQYHKKGNKSLLVSCFIFTCCRVKFFPWKFVGLPAASKAGVKRYWREAVSEVFPLPPYDKS